MGCRLSVARRNLYLDVAIGLGYLVALNPGWTGLQWHEWLGVAVGGALITHVVLHWRWVVAITKRLLGTLATGARVRYALYGVLLVAFLSLLGSGAVISSVFDMPFRLGLSVQAFALWIRVHAISSDVTVALVLLHLVLKRKWIAEHAKRLLPRRRTQADNAAPQGAVAQGSVAMECAEAAGD